MNLVDKLRKQNELDQRKMQQQLDVAKQLLAHDESREREILGKMGIDSCVKQYEDKKSTYLEKLNLIKKFGNDVFHIDQIKNMCVDYDLRFLPTQYFRGLIDTELGTKMRNFMEHNKINDYDLEHKFFIMAPTRQFEIQEVEIQTNQYDPLMFYKIDDEHYYLVHQWGKELNPLRYISAFRKRSFFHSQIHYLAVSFVVILAVLGLVSIATLGLALALAVGGALSFIFIRYRYVKNDNTRDINESYNVNLWNTNKKIKLT
ncbi:MAG: hypothetical protein ACNS62_10555 [Candidatus Cyclobacteriaceae bacterium M3_2C_046]